MDIEDILIDGQNVNKPAFREYIADRTATGAKFYSQGSESTAVTPMYGFNESRSVTLTGSPANRGACSFTDSRSYDGSGIADHIHGYQVAQGVIANAGLVSSYRAFHAAPNLNGAGGITTASLFNAENPSGGGPIVNLYGVRVAELTKSVSGVKYAITTEGATSSFFQGSVISGTGHRSRKNGADAEGTGPYFAWENALVDRIIFAQLNAANELAFHQFNGTSFRSPFVVHRDGIRLPHGSAPASPVNGDVWSTTTAMFHRINGVTKQVAYV